MSKSKLQAAVIGMGYWGPKFARNFLQHPLFDLVAVVDLDENKAETQISKIGANQTKVYSNVVELMDKHNIDLVHVAVPPQFHYEISMKFLLNGINVLVEKPVGMNMQQRSQLVKIANENGARIFVDHTYMFTSEYEEIRKMIRDNQVGRPIFYNSTRINLGIIQTETTVVEDLAVHDVALLDGILERLPIYVTCSGIAVFPSKMTSTAFATITYDDGFVAQLLVSWNSPVKVRQIQLAGTLGMITWDDMAGSDKIKIYNSRIDQELSNEEVRISYHIGEGRIPSVISIEAIRNELDSIASNLATGDLRIINGPDHILRVGKIVEALKTSLITNGEKVFL